MLLSPTMQSWLTFFPSTVVLVNWRILPLVLVSAQEFALLVPSHEGMQIPGSNWAAAVTEGVCLSHPLPAPWQCWPCTEAQPMKWVWLAPCCSCLQLPGAAQHSPAQLIAGNQTQLRSKLSRASCCYYSKYSRCLRVTLSGNLSQAIFSRKPSYTLYLAILLSSCCSLQRKWRNTQGNLEELVQTVRMKGLVKRTFWCQRSF